MKPDQPPFARFDPFDGAREEESLFDRAVKELGGDLTKLTPQQVTAKMDELAASSWSEETIQQVLGLGPLAIFTRLVTHYPPQRIRQMDLELMALKTAPTSTQWRSPLDGAVTGCLGFPERVRHVVLEYLRWRREGLLNHAFCKCHTGRN